MKSPVITAFLLLPIYFYFGQTTKEQKFNAAIQEIAIAFSMQDSAKISKYTSKEIGLYQLDRVGMYDHYNHFKTLTFSGTTYPKILFRNAKDIKLMALEYSSLPAWDCDKEVWSKKGLFVDTTKIDYLLSKICKSRNKFGPDTIPEKKTQFFYELETKSRRIVFYDNDGIELVFYMSYLNGNWYLTIVDNVSSDCSA